MAKPNARRLAGWIVIAGLVLVVVLAAFAARWDVALATLAVLVGLDTAMTFDQRVRHGHAARQSRELIKAQKATNGRLKYVSERLRTLTGVPELVREHDRRLLGVLEKERLDSSSRDESLERRLTAIEAALQGSAEVPGRD